MKKDYYIYFDYSNSWDHYSESIIGKVKYVNLKINTFNYEVIFNKNRWSKNKWKIYDTPTLIYGSKDNKIRVGADINNKKLKIYKNLSELLLKHLDVIIDIPELILL